MTTEDKHEQDSDPLVEYSKIASGLSNGLGTEG